MAGICTLPASQFDGNDRPHKWSRKYIKVDHNDMNGMKDGPINWPPTNTIVLCIFHNQKASATLASINPLVLFCWSYLYCCLTSIEKALFKKDIYTNYIWKWLLLPHNFSDFCSSSIKTASPPSLCLGVAAPEITLSPALHTTPSSYMLTSTSYNTYLHQPSLYLLSSTQETPLSLAINYTEPS